jgi:hypothetical protein
VYTIVIWLSPYTHKIKMFQIKKKRRRGRDDANKGGVGASSSNTTIGTFVQFSSSASSSSSSSSITHQPKPKGLSFFAAAAERSAKRRKLLSEELHENGGIVQVDDGRDKKKVEINAIPLQESSLFSGATKFEDDIADRPEALSVDDEMVFKAMPVEAFGMAMLRGMGWAPGKPVGGTVQAIVAPYVPETRGGRMGIGAIKALEEAEQQEEGKKKKKKKTTEATVSTMPTTSLSGAASDRWLCSGIRVRIVDETMQLDGGRRYGQKGVVNDVSPAEDGGVECTLVMDSDGVTVAGAHGLWLSTALPKKGGRVRVVDGDRRGNTGVLLKRDKKRQQATIQFDNVSSGATSVLSYDQVSELVENY